MKFFLKFKTLENTDLVLFLLCVKITKLTTLIIFRCVVQYRKTLI